MQAFCPVSLAIKFAAFCLVLGVVIGFALALGMSTQESQPQPSRAPTTQAADAPPGQPE
ncbi:hypothetical protein [Actinophytocola xinjiangensis]|uniref:hypothetical protein n=1 Tax=Actinophytocola xinjiangensis TaxID=485602 RepID=UPI000A67014E|nr:hypothetical protein [Actinophytocola xinjiangensis]